MVSQIASFHQVKHQIKGVSVLKGVVHVNQKGRIQLGQQNPFVYNALNRLFCDYSKINSKLHWFKHLLHGIIVPCFYVLDSPNFSEPTFSDDVIVAEEFSLQFKIAENLCLQFYFSFSIRFFW